MGKEARVRGSEPIFLVVLLLCSGANPVKPGQIFSHRTHEKADGKLRCEGCHASETDGRLRPTGLEHKPCNDAACHAAEFRTKDSALCFSCHASNDPAIKNPPKSGFASHELSSTFSHKDHLAREPKNGPRCAACHARESGQSPPALPPGMVAPEHVVCGACHAERSKPLMPDCKGCHALRNAEAAKPAASGWRVSKKFSHQKHHIDARSPGTPLDCELCHAGAGSVPVGSRPSRPKMALCAESCHNGTVAFKATGFECLKCHEAK
jgi:hypothetical protein